MNDVGLPFESYDHFGRYRALELGKPVDASGGIEHTGDARIDGLEADGAVAFVRALAKSERVEQVFVRHAFRFFLGRNENLGDGKSLQVTHQAYRDQNGSFNALLIALLSSDSFLYRNACPQAPTPMRWARPRQLDSPSLHVIQNDNRGGRTMNLDHYNLNLDRRNFLLKSGLGVGSLALAPIIQQVEARASGAGPKAPRFVFVVESNGLPPQQMAPSGITRKTAPPGAAQWPSRFFSRPR